MHTELIKHKMREDGEDNIYDTAGMAICLGVVQNYTFEEDTATKVWKLTRKENPDEDALFGGFAGAGGDDEASAKMVEGLLLTKKACMDFAEELQLEISEVRIVPAFTRCSSSAKATQDACTRSNSVRHASHEPCSRYTSLFERAWLLTCGCPHPRPDLKTDRQTDRQPTHKHTRLHVAVVHGSLNPNPQTLNP